MSAPSELPQTGGTQTPAGTIAVIPYKPTAPKYGGIQETGPQTWDAWTGGKPKADWSGLEDPSPSIIKATQFRPKSVSSQSKSRHYRVKGSDTKFTRDDDLLTFQKKIMKHFKTHGLDTITYLEDPTDPTRVVSVIDDHARFNHKAGVKKANETMEAHYDSYAKSDDSEATEYLIDSLDPALENQLYESCTESDSFAAHWLKLIQIIRSVSIERFDKIKSTLKGRKASDYAAENIESMCTDFLNDFKELNGAGMYDQNLTLTMLNSLMEAGGNVNEDYRYPLRGLKERLDTKLLEIRHMGYDKAQQVMISDELDAQSVLTQAKEHYRKALDNGKWPAASHAKDSKALNKNYGSINMTKTSELKNLVNSLIQSVNGTRDKTEDICNLCGQKGHWARDCPNKKKIKNEPRRSPLSNPKNKSGKSSRTPAKRSPGSKIPPPKQGESEIKFVNGKKHYWCAKCKRWTLSHGTEGHKTKEELQQQRSANSARLSFDLHPSIHMADGSQVNKVSSNQGSLLTLLLALLSIGTFLAILIGIDMSLTRNWTSILEVFNHGLNLLEGLLLLVWNPLLQNWLTILFGCLSGGIGFGTAAWLSSRVTSKSVRMRSGINILKQVRRQTKYVPPHARRRSLNSRVIPPHWTRQHLIPDVKYNNVGRNNRRELPRHIRIRMTRKRIENLEKEIKRLTMQLARARTNLNEQKKKLKALLSTKPVKSQRDRKMKARQCRKLRLNSVNPKKIKSLGTFVQCAMLQLINLSAISSTQPKPQENNDVLFDSGANCCVSNQKEDFVGEFHPLNGNQLVDGLGKGLKIEGKGNVAWTFKSDDGMYRTIKVPCYYVPTSCTRIASTQEVLKANPKEVITMTDTGMTLSGWDTTPSLTIPYSVSSNLPTAATHPRPQVNKGSSKDPVPKFDKHPSLTVASNINLSEPEKELLRWHQRLGHLSMKRVQWLMRQGILGTTSYSKQLQSSASKLTHGPLCTGCQYAKQRRKTKPGSTKRSDPLSRDALKTNDLFPGARISVDHFECNPNGRLLDTFGKERVDAKYKGGCIFVDSATGYVHVELQTKFNSHETLNAKKHFESECTTLGVVAQSYISDDGSAFENAAFEAHLQQFHQTIRHSTPGGHHSNGIAERAISTVMSISRAMLHHAAIHWPEVADVELWPLAVLHAVHLLNRIPREDTGRSPLELFSRTTWPISKIHDFHVWGCPVYVLDSSLAGGRKIPRWKPRSSRCIYVGNSTKQGHSVPLVLNLDTGKITGQYHVVFDDWFHTVDSTNNVSINFDHDDWYRTFGLTEWQYIPDDDVPLSPVPPAPAPPGIPQQERLRAIRDQVNPIQPLPRAPSPSLTPSQLQSEPAPRVEKSPPPSTIQRETPIQEATIQREPPSSPISRDSTIQRESPIPVAPPPKTPSPQPSKPAAERPTEPTRRSQRTRSQAAPRRSQRTTPSLYRTPTVNHLDMDSEARTDPVVSKAAQTDPDTFNWDEAMASQYKKEFLAAADVEISQLVEKDTWFEDLKSNATTKIIPSQWVFRIKRSSDGTTIKKFKARICLRGDLQEDKGLSNYSPVASWISVRSFLVISAIRGWVTISIDFSNAFVQSKLPADDPVWMHVPRGYKSTRGPNYCLKLIKSLYGHKRAPLLWFNHSSEAFKKLGLTQSKHDECLWYGKDIMVVQYVDDCGISAPDQARIDKFVKDLRNLGFELTQEDSFEEFLGIKFKYNDDGSIECTQKGLIQKTLEAAGMSDCNPNSTPTTLHTLGSNKEGQPMTEAWNYRAICGMLLYLSTNTRPDIAFAVSQVCRFSNAPKKSHATAVKTILRYLKKTEHKGMIIKPKDSSFHLDLYVDADYCGLFGQEDARDSNSVRSRTGYIVILSGWPIIWKSQLQTHLSQSTLEAEYTALSASLRVFLPLQRLIEEMIGKTKSVPIEDTRLFSTVFEDNQSTYFLATNQRITNRTKYLLAKWHWFWDLYNEGMFKIVKCPTDSQLADFLTKPLPKVAYENNRALVQGW